MTDRTDDIGALYRHLGLDSGRYRDFRNAASPTGESLLVASQPGDLPPLARPVEEPAEPSRPAVSGPGPVRWLESLMHSGLLDRRRVLLLVLLAALIPVYAVVDAPLSMAWQGVFGLGCFAAALIINRRRGRAATLVLMVLSVLVSTRYIYWRVTDSVAIGADYRSFADSFFAIGLIFAEFYAYLVLLLGYFQVLWPLSRKPVPMPEDLSLWPSVDLYIPTYNEPLKVVKPTVLAALSVDWPRDKLRVYVLDDGRRPEFRAFCEEVGVTHLTRADSRHAKAGNLNRAMKKTEGEFIAIFDCDHVPTRSFLQVTLGWFLKDPRLGMLQTPHHFFSPDPFERNLGTFRSVPNEGELFYGLLQDGNDFWNATFFCGSCAVLRRTALEEVGGVAVETVTEDAHTALKMHRRGWNTAYINLPQAAGLATESLSAHVGQRIRWARGMAQVFRIDNPLFGKGLNLGQRLCYVNAMLHFFYGLPRLVFLTAPLSYLFFEAHIIQASALLILAYAAPSIALANLTNSRVQGRFRHSFWAEVYETVLATYILMPTTLALINPKLGKFNVTAKGGMIENEYFDRDIAKPYVVLLLLNLFGFAIGVMRFLEWNTHELDTVLLTMAWTVYNMIILGAALSVAWESRQVRRYIRVRNQLPARLRVQGQSFPATTADISEGGTALDLLAPLTLPLDTPVEVALIPEFKEVWMPARVTRSAGTGLAVAFEELNPEQEQQLVHCIFGRANAWLDWAGRRPADDVGRSFRQVIAFGVSGILKMLASFVVQARSSLSGPARPVVKAADPLRSLALVLIGAGCWLGADVSSAQAQETPPAAPIETPEPEGREQRVLSFSALGQQQPLRLRGTESEIHLPLSLRDDRLVTAASLRLNLAHSPSLLFERSHLNVLLNGELAATLPLSAETASARDWTVEFDPRLFVDYNQITLQWIAHYAQDCENPDDSSLWAIVSDRSRLTLQTEPLALPDELSRLPQPFFDLRDGGPLVLPFVFAGTPEISTLRSAAVLASWLGAQAAYRRAAFPVSLGAIPSGHGVLFGLAGKLPPGVTLPPELRDAEAAIAILDHPSTPGAKLLLVFGQTPEGLDRAVLALVLGQQSFNGPVAVINSLREPPPRKPYDAPRWIPSDRPVTIGELAEGYALQVSGSTPAAIRVPFRLAPDLFWWQSEGVSLDLRYRHLPSIGPRSSLNIQVNDKFVGALPLSHADLPGGEAEPINLPFVPDYEATGRVEVDLPDYVLGPENTLQLQYYFDRPRAGACQDVPLNNLAAAIDPESTLDVSGRPHFTFLPDLALFAGSGFPFTRLADLAETAILIPQNPQRAEIEVLLQVMGRLGSITGLAGTRVALVGSDQLDSVAERDLLVLGSFDRQPLLQVWGAELPLLISADGARLRTLGLMERLRASWQGARRTTSLDAAGELVQSAGTGLGALMGLQSPLTQGRSVVVISGAETPQVKRVAEALTDAAQIPFLRGDLVLFNNDRFYPYQIAAQYELGDLPFFLWLRWRLSEKPLLMVLMTLAVAVALGAVSYRALRRMAIARQGA